MQEVVNEKPESPATTIVVSAGNAHGSHTHARLALTRGSSEHKCFTWRVGPDNPTESYLEIWLPDGVLGDKVGGRELCHDFSLTIQPPGGATPCRVTVGQAFTLVDEKAPGKPLAGIVFSQRVAQGTKGTMVLIAARPTARVPINSEVPGIQAVHGEWTIEVYFGQASHATAQGKTPDLVVVHAWVERNDKLFGTPRRQQSTVYSTDPIPDPTEYFPSVIDFCKHDPAFTTSEVPRPFEPEFSLSSLANGPVVEGINEVVDKVDIDSAANLQHIKTIMGNESHSVVVVGGYRALDGEMASYSSGGPVRMSSFDNTRLVGGVCPPVVWPDSAHAERVGPDFDAVSDIGIATRGIRTSGFRPGLEARLSGTSAAAPSVTRYIANLRSSDQAEFPTGTPRPNPPGPVDPSRPTPTPTKDDRFRKGRVRLRPGKG